MFNRCLILTLLLLAPAALAAYFDGCDNTYDLKPGTTYVESPYYPRNYPAGTSCRYKFTAPQDYNIQVQCTIALPSNNGACTTDNFWLDTEGDLLMRGAENFCGSGTISRESLFRELVFAYISTGTQGGNFRCTLTATKQNCNCGWSATQRIANGESAGANEFPSMVALKDVTKPYERSFCGGTIVAHRYIVTAAHCIYHVSQATNIVAIVGTNNLNSPSSSRYYQQYNIQQVIIHEKYNPDANNDDIALLVTASNIMWSRGVGPACLPPVGTSQTFSYDTVDVIGYGTIFFSGPVSNGLQKINLMVVNNQDCQTEYSDVNIYNSQMCTYDYSGNGRDSCQYDSGGPVILRRARQFLVGIVSFGKSCAGSQYPMGVNTRVTSYVTWIRQNIGNSNCVVSL